MTKARTFLFATAAPLMLPVAFLAASSAACSSSSTAGPPIKGTYTVQFLSLDAAAETNKLQLYVFEEADGADQCGTLIQERKAGATLPASLVSTTPVTLCSLNTTTGGANELGIDFGTYAVLVVALDSTGAGLFIGCKSQTISASQPNVVVSTTFFGSQTSVPVSGCTSLTQHCAGPCM